MRNLLNKAIDTGNLKTVQKTVAVIEEMLVSENKLFPEKPRTLENVLNDDQSPVCYTPLMHAASLGHPEIMRYLIELGANVSKHGSNPLGLNLYVMGGGWRTEYYVTALHYVFDFEQRSKD